MTLTSAAVMLFLVMDPLGNIAFFLSALKQVPESRRRLVIIRELLIALGILIIFLFAGKNILEWMRISEPALSASGGIILLLIALRMIFPSADKPIQEPSHGEPFIVPLAIPYVAGPSAMATEILLMSQEPARWTEWLLALLIAWSLTSLILYFATGLQRYLGEKGLVALERLMGMILVTVSVQMLMNGVGKFLGIGA